MGQDGTLIAQKAGSFNVSRDDWRWYNKKIAEILRDYHEKGYAVVIFRCG